MVSMEHGGPRQHLTCVYVITHESTPVVMITDHIPTHRYILLILWFNAHQIKRNEAKSSSVAQHVAYTVDVK
jgi:hypothetical protein